MGSSLYLSGGVQNTSKLVKTFATANSFAVGDVVRYDVASTSFVKAQADNATNSEVVGVVSEASANSFSVVYSGEIDLTSVSTLSGFSGPVLFLTSSVAGGLTANPPSAIGSVVKPLVVRNAATNQYVVTNFLGTQIGGSSTVAIDQIQPVGTIMPFAGSAIPDSWLECNGASYAVGAYPQLYAKMQNSSGDRVPAYGYVATLFGTSVNTVLSAGDYIQYKTDTGAWTGTGSPFAGAASNAALLAVVLSVSSTAAVVQVIPIYSSTTKNFTINNTVFTSGGFVGVETGTGNYRAYKTDSTFKGVSLTITSVAITHFNTPDLRGRFALGVNAPNGIGELETDSFISAISGNYPLGSEGGQEFVAAPGIKATLNPSGSVNAAANFTNDTMANMPPYTVVRYIIKASPYTRAAIIDGLDLPYNNLLVGDLRDGALRPGGSGEDLVFKINNGVGGTERMRLSNAGRLGIATTSPRALLDVTSSSAGTIIAYGTSSVYGTIGTDSSSNSVYNAWSGHVWQNGGTEKLRLSGAGDLGIGTASPGYTLDLTTNGTARLGSAIITPASTTISSTNIFTTGSGGLAIGTSTTPTAKAEIHGADGTKQGLFVNQTGTDAASVSTTLATMWTRAPVHLKMAGTATTRLLLGGVGSNVSSIQSATSSSAATSLSLQTYGGNLGIGVADPQYRVDINSPGGIDAVRIKTGQSASLLRFEDAGTASTPQIGSAGNDLLLRTNGTDRIRVTQSGVGVSSVWIPTILNFGWSRKAGVADSAVQGYEPISNPVTMPGSATETYTIIVIFPQYSYDPGDGVIARTYTGIPGGAVLKFANDEAALQYINGVLQAGTFNGTGGWRGQGHIQAYRTA